MPAKSSVKTAKMRPKSKRVSNAGYKNIKSGAKNAEKKGVFFFNLFIAAAVIICILGAVNNYFIKTEQRKERLEILESEYNSLRIKNDAFRNKLETSRNMILDEDYVINFARANGLRKDNEFLFYLYPEE